MNLGLKAKMPYCGPFDTSWEPHCGIWKYRGRTNATEKESRAL